MNMKCKVRVEDLRKDTTRKDLESFFKKCGPLNDVWLPPKDPTGYAYVEFMDPRDAEDAAQYMDRKYNAIF